MATPFLTKTYQLVDDETSDRVISWNGDGSAFIVWNAKIFARDLLPKYFKHNNFTSFLRQLNTYGFRKVVSDRWEFSHECFRRGKKQLLSEIQRRKFSTPVAIPTAQPITSPENSGDEQAISSNASPMGALAELIDENEKLRNEKVQLTEQLVQVKCVCNNIFSLISNFAENQSKNSFKLRESILTSTKSLDLFPMKRFLSGDEAEATAEERNPIGAPIGAKRAREHEECYSALAEEDIILRLQPPNIGNQFKAVRLST